MIIKGKVSDIVVWDKDHNICHTDCQYLDFSYCDHFKTYLDKKDYFQFICFRHKNCMEIYNKYIKEDKMKLNTFLLARDVSLLNYDLQKLINFNRDWRGYYSFSEMVNYYDEQLKILNLMEV